MERRLETILSNDLRDGMICVERKGDSMAKQQQAEKVPENYMTAIFGMMEQFEKATSRQIETVTVAVKENALNIKHNAESIGRFTGKLTNGWGDTLKRHDEEIKEKISEKTFNSAMKSIREYIDEKIHGVNKQLTVLMWIFGICFPALLGAIITLIILVSQGGGCGG